MLTEQIPLFPVGILPVVAYAVKSVFTQKCNSIFNNNISVLCKYGIRVAGIKEYGGKKDKVGFIAEDVEKLFPNCVSYDPKGVITGIDYSSFVPYIIEIIKQQAAEIEELKSMIAS